MGKLGTRKLERIYRHEGLADILPEGLEGFQITVTPRETRNPRMVNTEIFINHCKEAVKKYEEQMVANEAGSS